jgi:hypothetical protein
VLLLKLTSLLVILANIAKSPIPLPPRSNNENNNLEEVAEEGEKKAHDHHTQISSKYT